MRGGAVIIVTALVGAWALGLADAEEKEKTPPNVVQEADPDDQPSYDIKGADAVEKAEERRTREADRTDSTQDPGIQSIADTADDPTSSAPDPTPSGADPTTPTSDPDWDPDDPTHTPNPPSNPPSNPPNQPEEECTDLVSGLNCVLDGVLGGGRP